MKKYKNFIERALMDAASIQPLNKLVSFPTWHYKREERLLLCRSMRVKDSGEFGFPHRAYHADEYACVLLLCSTLLKFVHEYLLYLCST